MTLVTTRNTQRGLRALLIAALLALGIGMAQAAPNTTIYGVTADGALVTFEVTAPEAVTSVGTITGLAEGEAVVGVDFRPETGELFAIAVSGENARLYALDLATAEAAPVGDPFPIQLADAYGFDFNPTVDLIRFITSSGGNYRLNPDDGTVAGTDSALAYAMDDMGEMDEAEPMETPEAEADAAMTEMSAAFTSAAAYTNSFNGAKGTVMYVLDSESDSLVVVNPPNDGVMRVRGAVGVDFSADAQFDIATDGTAYAALTVDEMLGLYTLNLITGAATLVAPIGSGMDTPLVAISVEPADSPVVGVNALYAVTASGELITFARETPEMVTVLGAITGLGEGEQIVGLDARPETGELFALAVNGDAARLYTLDGAATATPVGEGFSIPAAEQYGFDFNPTVDLIRLVTSAGANYRLNPDDGTIAGEDVSLVYRDTDMHAGMAPAVGTAGYTNSFNGAKATILYVLDAETGALAIVNPPNDGVVNSIPAVDAALSGVTAFDIDVDGTALLVAEADGGPGLYTLNLLTGATTLVNTVGDGMTVEIVALTSGMLATP